MRQCWADAVQSGLQSRESSWMVCFASKREFSSCTGPVLIGAPIYHYDCQYFCSLFDEEAAATMTLALSKQLNGQKLFRPCRGSEFFY